MAVIDGAIEYFRTHAPNGGELEGLHYQAKIAAVIGCSTRQLRRAIVALVKAGILRTVRECCNEWDRRPLRYFFVPDACPTVEVLSTNSDDLASDEVVSTPRKPVSVEQRAINKIRRARYVRQFVDTVMDSGAATARAALEVLSWHVKRYGNLLDVLRYNALKRAMC